MKLITRKEYMQNSSRLFNEYYSQFATEQTKQFIINRIGVDKIKKSKCPHLNDTANHSRGGWVWDYSPINLTLARQAGEVGRNSLPSPATHTCIGKACAKLMLKNGEV